MGLQTLSEVFKQHNTGVYVMNIDINEPKPSITITFDSEEEMIETLEKLDKITDTVDIFFDSLGVPCKVGDVGGFSDVSVERAYKYMLEGEEETLTIYEKTDNTPYTAEIQGACEYFVKGQK